MFVYLHFNLPSNRMTNLVRNVLDEFIEMGLSPLSKLLLSSYQTELTKLVIIQSFIQLMNTPLITFVL